MKSTTQSGYTLLFAVLTASLVLSVAVFILGVSRKQFILAVSARESIYAIYNADSAIECAALAYSAGTFATTSAPVMSCGGLTVTGSWSGSGYSVPTITTIAQSNPLTFGFTGTGGVNTGCAYVVVTDGTDSTGSHVTVVDARGYNTGTTATCPGTSSTVVERALRLTYH